MLKPIPVGHRSSRETVLNAVAARGHLIYRRLPDAVFFVDPSDRAISTESIWRGSWQREEIDGAVSLGDVDPHRQPVRALADIRENADLLVF